MTTRPSSAEFFDADHIRTLLGDLGRRLAEDGLHGDLYIVGGAAIALTWDARRTTRDIDAVFRPHAQIADLADAMAEEQGLPRGWLSSAVAAFLPDEDDADTVRWEIPGLTIMTASPEHLLAMKLAAARPGRDLDDLALLFRTLGIETPEEALAIARRLYGEGSVVLSDDDESYLLLAEEVLRRGRARRDEP